MISELKISEVKAVYAELKKAAIAYCEKGQYVESWLAVRDAVDVIQQFSWEYCDDELEQLSEQLSKQFIADVPTNYQGDDNRVVVVDDWCTSYVLVMQYIDALVAAGKEILYITSKDIEASSYKNIIPTMLAENKKLIAYRFEGYWKDVGTIDSLWEANMDLLDENCDLNLDDPTWKIYTEDAVALPAYIGPDASIDRAYITQGTSIDGTIKNSVIFTGATVGKGAKIIDSVLMPGVCVGDGAVVTRALVADDVKISAGAVVGSADSEEITLQASDI